MTSGSAYTVLRVRAPGVITLRAGHAERLVQGASPADAQARLAQLDALAAAGVEGVFRVRADGPRLLVEQRPGAALRAGLSTRVLRSPLAAGAGVVTKAPSPSAWDAVRTPGVLTLLTDTDGRLLQEACIASLVAWDGRGLALVPSATPRSRSLAEEAIAQALPHVRAPIALSADWALAACNAVAGPFELALPGRRPFPADALAALRDVLER